MIRGAVARHRTADDVDLSSFQVMAAPARAGLFIYAKDVARLARFYQALLGGTVIRGTRELVVLQAADVQLVISAMPEPNASTVTIDDPPQPRDQAALKFFFTVSSLAAAELTAGGLGGRLFGERWNGPGFRVCNACDPEGNIFQLREPAT